MTINLSKRKLTLGAVILLLTFAAGLAGIGFVRLYSLNNAKSAARQYLPSNAEFLSYYENDHIYAFRFFDSFQQERSEIEVDKTSSQIIKIQTQKVPDVFPETAALNEDALLKIVKNEIPDADINNMTLSEGPQHNYSSITFITDDSRGLFLLDSSSGTVIARTIKFGRPKVIPSEIGDDIGLLTLTELRGIGSQRVPGAVLQDLDIVYTDGHFSAEMDLYKDGNKYSLVLDAVSGDELGFSFYKDDWKEYGNWEPIELEKPLLDIVNLDDSLTISKSSGDTAASQVTSESSFSNETHTNPDTTNPSSDSSETQPSATASPTAVPTQSPKETQPDLPAVTPAPEQIVIGTERVKALVLSRLPDAQIGEIELDEDDGRLIYKGSAVSSETEFDFEIDAYTGTFAKWDADSDD